MESAAQEADRGDPAVHQKTDCQEQHNNENDQDPIFREQESSGAFIDGGGDFPHALGPSVSLGDISCLVGCEQQCDHCKDGCQVNHGLFHS